MSDSSDLNFVPKGPEDDARIIKTNLMDELCKRQSNFENDGEEDRWNFEEVCERALKPFDRGYAVSMVKACQKESRYFDIENDNKIGLASRGKSYCKDSKR
jgi:hypothetical protein